MVLKAHAVVAGRAHGDRVGARGQDGAVEAGVVGDSSCGCRTPCALLPGVLSQTRTSTPGTARVARPVDDGARYRARVAHIDRGGVVVDLAPAVVVIRSGAPAWAASRPCR